MKSSLLTLVFVLTGLADSDALLSSCRQYVSEDQCRYCHNFLFTRFVLHQWEMDKNYLALTEFLIQGYSKLYPAMSLQEVFDGVVHRGETAAPSFSYGTELQKITCAELSQKEMTLSTIVAVAESSFHDVARQFQACAVHKGSSLVTHRADVDGAVQRLEDLSDVCLRQLLRERLEVVRSKVDEMGVDTVLNGAVILPHAPTSPGATPIPSTASTTLPPPACATCGPDEGSCGQGGSVSLCPSHSPICLTSMVEDNNAHRNITRRCASESECLRLWWQETRPTYYCYQVDRGPLYFPIDCSFCCSVPACNQGPALMPAPHTLFQSHP